MLRSLALAASRFFGQKDQHNSQHTEGGRHAQRPAPRVQRHSRFTADNIPETRTDRNGKVEHGQHFRAHLVHEQITDNSRCNGAVRSLADADERTEREEPAVAGHERTDQRGAAPQGHAEDHDPFARVSIAQIAENRREYHVRYDECGLQQTALGVTDAKFILNVGEDTCE